MPLEEIGPLRVRYELRGQGHPLVMIMGLTASLDAWEPVTLRLLARRFRVLVFDNRDAGGTTFIGEPVSYSIKDMADDVARLMDHVGFDRAHVVGVSMGGMIAQELVLGHPDRVDRLVLACTVPGAQSGLLPTSEVLETMAAAPQATGRWSAALRLASVAMTPGWPLTHFWRLPAMAIRNARYAQRPEGYVRQMGAVGGFEAGERLRGIRTPTLIVHGDKDILLPPDNARRLAELIPGARLEIYRGAPHGFTTERPRQFARTVEGFLR